METYIRLHVHMHMHAYVQLFATIWWEYKSTHTVTPRTHTVTPRTVCTRELVCFRKLWCNLGKWFFPCFSPTKGKIASEFDGWIPMACGGVGARRAPDKLRHASHPKKRTKRDTQQDTQRTLGKAPNGKLLILLRRLFRALPHILHISQRHEHAVFEILIFQS